MRRFIPFTYLSNIKTYCLKGKLLGILLILCFVAPIATTSIVLQIQKKQVKKEVKRRLLQGIDRSELVLLKFSEDDKNTRLKWKHSKEFEFEGEMYDVVETMLVGDSTHYWVWWDDEETKLNHTLNDLAFLAFGNRPKKQEHQQRFSQFFKSFYLHAYDPDFLYAEDESNLNPPFYPGFFHSNLIDPFVPPPEKIRS
jgi:hypothetical protein